MMHIEISRYFVLRLAMMVTEAQALDGKQASFNFGYAMQAAGSCKSLKMRLDTENRLEAKFGIKLRGAAAPYREAYTDGLVQAHRDAEKGICEKAWTWNGCSGTKHPRVLIQNQFHMESPQVCPY